MVVPSSLIAIIITLSPSNFLRSACALSQRLLNPAAARWYLMAYSYVRNQYMTPRDPFFTYRFIRIFHLGF